MKTELLADGHEWLRIADRDWGDPLDPSYAEIAGGRWNPPHSFPVLYLNEDVVTARLNVRAFVSEWPYEPEDLRTDTGPVLIAATLPQQQRVIDVHTPDGVASVGLPATYPADAEGGFVGHPACQAIGAEAKTAGHDGIRCRSAQSPDGEGRELAWYPRKPEMTASSIRRLSYEDWYWG